MEKNWLELHEKNTVLTIPEAGRVELATRPYPKVASGFVLVKIAIAPVCIEHQIYRDHTFEWHEDETHLGHEGVGTVVELGSASEFEVGEVHR